MVERKTNDPLNYLGVRASTPNNMTIQNRAPTDSDTTGTDGPFVIGDLWFSIPEQELYVFTSTSSPAPSEPKWRSFGIGL